MKLKEIFENTNQQRATARDEEWVKSKSKVRAEENEEVMSLEEIEQALDDIAEDTDGEPSPQAKKMIGKISKMIKGKLTSDERRMISVKMEELLELVRKENESK